MFDLRYKIENLILGLLLAGSLLLIYHLVELSRPLGLNPSEAATSGGFRFLWSFYAHTNNKE
jgi:hypothetical protein